VQHSNRCSLPLRPDRPLLAARPVRWPQTPTDTHDHHRPADVVEYDVTADVIAFLNGTRNKLGWIVRKLTKARPD